MLKCSVISTLRDPWTIAFWVLLSMEFSRQEYWSELSFPPLGDLPSPGIKAMSPGSLALAGGFFYHRQPGKPLLSRSVNQNHKNISYKIFLKFWFYISVMCPPVIHFCAGNNVKAYFVPPLWIINCPHSIYWISYSFLSFLK